MGLCLIFLAIAAAGPGQESPKAGSPDAGSIAPQQKLLPAALEHRGDKRSYVVYPDKRMTFTVQSPASVEVAVRAVFAGKKKRARVQLKLRSAGQILLDQSQTLGRDHRAKYSGGKVSRPLVAVADIPEGSKTFSIELKYRSRKLKAVIVSVKALKYEDDELSSSTLSSSGDAMVPGLVGLGGGEAPSAEPSLEALVPAQSAGADKKTGGSAASAKPESHDSEALSHKAPYVPGRYVAVAAGLQFGLGLPGVELAARYYLPFWSERISLGANIGYSQIYEQRSLDFSQSASLLRLRLHLLSPGAFVQAELWRDQRFFAGFKLEGGALPFFGSLQQQTLLGTEEDHIDESELSGLTWFAGGSAVAGINLPFGELELNLGYRYAPAAEASDSRDERRHVSAPILGPYLAIAYVLVW